MQVKKLQRNDRFNMKRKSCKLRIHILYGSTAIVFRSLMFWNKKNHKKYGFVLILCLFLDSTTFKTERGDKFFRKRCQVFYFTYFICQL